MIIYDGNCDVSKDCEDSEELEVVGYVQCKLQNVQQLFLFWKLFGNSIDIYTSLFKPFFLSWQLFSLNSQDVIFFKLCNF